MNSNADNQIPTFKEWGKSNPHKSINDYYKIYGNKLSPGENTSNRNEPIKPKERHSSKTKWIYVVGVPIITLLSIVLVIVILPHSKFSMFVKDKVGISSNQIQGKYVRVSDNGKGNDLLGAMEVTGLVSYIEFNGKHCTFNYFGILINAPYEIDGASIYIYEGGELGVLKMEIVDGNKLEGEGWIDGTFVKQ